jgi:hypothetical protein
VVPIVEDITNHMLELESLRLAVHQRHRTSCMVFSHKDLLRGSVPYLHNSATRLLSSPPKHFAGRALVQRAKGYRYHFVGRERVKPSMSSRLFNDIIPGQKWVAYHSAARAGVYLYFNNTICKDYWKEEEIVDHWPLIDDEEQAENCEPQTGEERKILVRHLYEMRGWMDKRGDEML